MEKEDKCSVEINSKWFYYLCTKLQTQVGSRRRPPVQEARTSASSELYFGAGFLLKLKSDAACIIKSRHFLMSLMVQIDRATATVVKRTETCACSVPHSTRPGAQGHGIAAACVQPSRHVARRTVHRRRRLCMDIRAPITHTPTPSSSPFWPFILTSSHPHCLCACHATCPRLMIRFATSDSTSSSSLFYTWLYHKTELYLGPSFVCNFVS